MIDTVRILVRGGRGGNGCISFRREKFVPKGGPDGGDGGDGGSAYLVGDSSLNTLLHLKYHSTWLAGRGAHGGGKKKRGGNGAGVNIPVPMGTVVWHLGESGDKEFMADIVDQNPVLIARGGAGGAGNTRFVSSRHQEPVLAERGDNGQDINLFLELKLLADVGLVGAPNVGKSSLISRCSAARPQIAPYPFTTTEPVLGVVETRNRIFVIMEVPGLIEGAHTGTGLGHEFLRHTERSRLFWHVLDGLSTDPVADLHRINNELGSFDSSLSQKSQIIVVNKIDVPDARNKIQLLTAELQAQGVPVHFISAATGEGLEELLGTTLKMLDNLPKEELEVPERRRLLVQPKLKPTFRVTRQNGDYIVHAPTLERLVPMANMKDSRAVAHLWREMQKLGVAKALEAQGVQPGDTVKLGSVGLEWF